MLLGLAIWYSGLSPMHVGVHRLTLRLSPLGVFPFNLLLPLNFNRVSSLRLMYVWAFAHACWCPSSYPSPFTSRCFSIQSSSAIEFQSCFYFTSDVSAPIGHLGLLTVYDLSQKTSEGRVFKYYSLF